MLSEEEIVGGWQWAVGREEEGSAECRGKKKGRELAVGDWRGGCFIDTIDICHDWISDWSLCFFCSFFDGVWLFFVAS